MIVAWGKKIGLRPFEDALSDSDVARVYRWSCDDGLLRLSGGAPTDLTFEEFRGRLRRDAQNPPIQRHAYFLMTHEGELIGRAGCFAIDDQYEQGELGIVIGERRYWGKGYGSDAVVTLLQYLFTTTPLARINLFTYVDNLRAHRCFEKSGFRVIGTARRFSPDHGEFDGFEMEITRREFYEQWFTTEPNFVCQPDAF